MDDQLSMFQNQEVIDQESKAQVVTRFAQVVIEACVAPVTVAAVQETFVWSQVLAQETDTAQLQIVSTDVLSTLPVIVVAQVFTVSAVVNVQPVTAQAVNEAAVQEQLVNTQADGVHISGVVRVAHPTTHQSNVTHSTVTVCHASASIVKAVAHQDEIAFQLTVTSSTVRVVRVQSDVILGCAAAVVAVSGANHVIVETAHAVNEAAVQVTLVITQEAGVHNAGHVSVGDVRVLFVRVWVAVSQTNCSAIVAGS